MHMLTLVPLLRTVIQFGTAPYATYYAVLSLLLSNSLLTQKN
jgi:hypothetical protein